MSRIPMFPSLEMLDRALREHLEEIRFYSRQSWVFPGLTSEGEMVHDVVVVGAGQSGLALTYELRLRGIRRIAVVDSQRRDESGPWSSFARMPRLRSPKQLGGPECGNPLLSFRAWFCSKYSREEYEGFEFVSLPHWREYLAWYRQVLGIEPINEATITAIGWDPEEGCFALAGESAAGEPLRLYGRKVCLATGMVAAGCWAPPHDLVAGLPRSAFSCAWEELAPTRFRGRDVAVIGAGASGFDSASYAVESGCRSVTVFGRRPFPEEDIYLDLWRGRDDSDVFPAEAGEPAADVLEPLLAHNAEIDDGRRLGLIAGLFKHGRCPVSPEYLARLRNRERMRVLDGCSVEAIEPAAGGGLLLSAGGEGYEFDHVVFATPPLADLASRPELSRLAGEILTWADAATPGAPEVPGLGGYPKLSPSFQLQPRRPGADYLKHVYSLADVVHVTVGMQSVPHVVPTVARHIGRSLYAEQYDSHLSFIAADHPAGHSAPAVVAGTGGGR